jgi:hypothetical protein
MKLLTILLLILISCTSGKNNNRIVIGNYSLEVKFDCDSNIQLNNSSIHKDIPTCKKQTLIFKHKNTIINKLNYPVKKIIQKTLNETNIEMDANVITELGIIKAKKNVFYVAGYGGCNTCPIWEGIYSLEGNLLWHYYGNKNIIINQSGNINELLEDIKFSIKDFNLSNFEKIRIR